MPHHGIMPSIPGFLEAVQPQAAVVTNQRLSVPKTDKQLSFRGLKPYYTYRRDVYLAADGKVWVIYQGKNP